MREAVIVKVLRTPVGKKGGWLASVEPWDLSAQLMNELFKRMDMDPSLVDDVVWGNLFALNAANIGRLSWLYAGLPIEVPAVTIDRQCSSSLNALAYGAMMINYGNADIVLTGGVESYSRMPWLLKRPMTAHADPQLDAYASSVKNTPMIITAENLSEKYNTTREECDEFAVRSQNNAARAWQEGLFNDHVMDFVIPQRKGDPIVVKAGDECVRASTMEGMAKLKAVMKKDGTVTAGNASPMNDGASAMVVMSAEKAKELGYEPLARIAGFAASGVDPDIMGIGPVAATRKLMKHYNLKIDDFDTIELNEAFAAQSIPCIKELEIDINKCNPNGGAIAIGHPNAASGGILVARAVGEMARKNYHRALISFCIGGGQGFSLILER